MGACTGLEDAADFAKVIAAGVTNESIGVYEEQMRRRADTAVVGSQRGGNHIWGMKSLAEYKPADLWKDQ